MTAPWHDAPACPHCSLPVVSPAARLGRRAYTEDMGEQLRRDVEALARAAVWHAVYLDRLSRYETAIGRGDDDVLLDARYSAASAAWRARWAETDTVGDLHAGMHALSAGGAAGDAARDLARRTALELARDHLDLPTEVTLGWYGSGPLAELPRHTIRLESL